MTLAQQFFEGAPHRVRPQSDLFARIESARDALSCGVELNHSAVSQKSLSEFIAADAKAAAQRFAVEDYDFNNLTRLGLDVLNTGIGLKLPAAKTWIEGPMTFRNANFERRAKVGGMLRLEQEWMVVDYFTDLFDMGIPIPWASGKIHHRGFSDMTVRCEWYLFEGSKLEAASDGDKVFSTLSNSMALLVGALNAPVVVNSTEVRWNVALQKSRIKRRKHPLLSFNKVKLILPKIPSSHSDAVRREGGDGVRFHSVLGHLRRLERPSGPELTWVRPHFRGDASRGVVVKERTIKAGKLIDVP